ncbi:MAG TPA: DUF6702 family protein [Lunatimonas sp.]|nr:DUF6702 family protein [Lunatimonas sp.]
MLSFHLSVVSLFGLFTMHPFYISLTDMVYKADEQRLEIAQKIFWDDLEVALSRKHKTPVDFLNTSDRTQLDDMVREYLLAQNKIHVNGQLISLEYLGHEIEEDAAWFYFESTNVPRPREVMVRNSILTSEFPTQQNIVNFYVDQRPKSIITTADKPEGELRF